MLITLFTIAIVSYTINFGDDNDAVVKLGDDSEIFFRFRHFNLYNNN